MIRALLETGFLLSLNPRDRNHDWAVKLLKRARVKEVKLHISPAALVELSLILKSRGLPEEGIGRVFAAMDSIVRRYTRPSFPDLTFEVVSRAVELREEHGNLTFFDSIHAAVALTNDLEYYDLDEDVRAVVEVERSAGKSQG